MTGSFHWSNHLFSQSCKQYWCAALFFKGESYAQESHLPSSCTSVQLKGSQIRLDLLLVRPDQNPASIWSPTSEFSDRRIKWPWFLHIHPPLRNEAVHTAHTFGFLQIWHCFCLPFKSLGSVRFFWLMTYARHGCICLVKNDSKNRQIVK